MTCTTSQRLLELRLDGELTPRELVEVDDHIETCIFCQRFYDDLEEFKSRLHATTTRYALPDHVRRNIQGFLAKQARPQPLPWKWIAVASSLLLLVSLVWNVSLRLRNSASDLVADQVLSSHLRSLMGTHLLDIPSSDLYTVRAWFNGKVDFSPEVKDFSRQGFRLIGGRMDYLDGRPVAALVYQRQEHLVNLFLWPSHSAQGKARGVKLSGFNLLFWTDEGITCWAASDLQASELDQFVKPYE